LLLIGAPAVAAAQSAPAATVQGEAYAPMASSPMASSPIASDIARWNGLRQSDSQSFSAYASFLLVHRGWPGEAVMRGAAERRLSLEPVSPAEVLRYFSVFPPTTPAGHAYQAFALQATGRGDAARDAARRAWTAGVLPLDVEQRLQGAFGASFSQDDHERRIEALLGNGDSQSAARTLIWAPAARRSLYEARLALQNRSSDAYARVAALDPAFRRDGGLLLDQAIWLRNSGQSAAARQLLASRGPLDRPVANPARWLGTALTLARGAANDGQWSVAYGIASKLDGLYASGTDVSDRPYDERDDYTSLAWLGGSAALLRLGRPADAARMFELYGRAARSPQTRAKGFFWAARAANAAGNPGQASAWLELAAVSPDQFYGQLALERLGRSPPPPPVPPAADPAERAAFAARPLAEAVRYLGMTGRRGDQAVFVRALAVQLRDDRERVIAGEFGQAIGRLDLGVWAAREARAGGESFYARIAFPEVPIPPAYARNWAFAHGIMRQESSFDRSAVSNAGARGMMQLMPGTARQTAGRVGVPYDLGRLTEDAQYNVLLGNHYLSELMDEWGGNFLLVAAAYNAGGGNVRRWIAANGDPRAPGADVLRWIEEIPFAETRNYVQRVLENAVVYDLMNPNRGGAAMRSPLSHYLGQNPRG
jgi:soluble lytic murein transglycosylase